VLAVAAIAAFIALRPSGGQDTAAAHDPRPSSTTPLRSAPPAVAAGSLQPGPSTAPAATPPAVEATEGPHGGLGAPGEVIENPRDVRPASPETLTGYQWPLTNARITNGYGKGSPGNFEVDGVTFHDGLDISSFCGARIVAAHAGTILTAGRHHEAWLGWVGDLAPFRARMEEENAWGGQAITVVIDDGNGYRSVYAHLARKAVNVGDEVEAGDLIGYEGASGNATGCHLHFSIFSPLEGRTLALEPKVAEKTKLPPREIARIDPLLVLPPVEEARITWGWGTTPEE
jgi:murein DD-endopeptidase MepM/ murein hydrolase activator NlpD